MGRDTENVELRDLRKKIADLAAQVDDCATRNGLQLDSRVMPFFAALYHARRLRDQVFDTPGLFADPAWDMLLGLARAEGEGKVTAITSLCHDSAVPSTTALRWISVLIEADLIVRRPDPQDHRRGLVSLSPTGRRKLHEYSERIANLRGLWD